MFALLLCAVAGWLGGCATTPEGDFDPVVPQIYLEAPVQEPYAMQVSLPQSGVQIPVNSRVAFTEAEFANAELVQVDLGLCLLLEFRADAARDLVRVSASNLGRRLVLFLNGRAFGARLIDGMIEDGRLLFFVEVPDAELPATVLNLKRTIAEIQAALAKARK